MSSKRIRGKTSTPLATSIFGTEFKLGNKVSFNLTSIKKELIKGLLEADIWDALTELSIRATLRSKRITFGGNQFKVILLEKNLADSQTDLDDALKANSILTALLKDVTIHVGCTSKENLSTSYWSQWKKNNTLPRRTDDCNKMLTASLPTKMIKEDWEKKYKSLVIKLEDIEQQVMFQHEVGFQKALD